MCEINESFLFLKFNLLVKINDVGYVLIFFMIEMIYEFFENICLCFEFDF